MIVLCLGSDEVSCPQPMPRINVGSEKDRATLSPLAIKFWVRYKIIDLCKKSNKLVFFLVRVRIKMITVVIPSSKYMFFIA